MRSRKNSGSNICLLQGLRKLYRDAQGMSLVEVIIAITILGLVAVPVLHSLTTAMVYNQKARNRQEMTLTAESIMETFKGYDLETFKTQFDSGNVPILGVTASSYSPTTTKSVGLSSGENATEYGFMIKGLDMGNGQQLYDVRITATPNSLETVMVPDKAETTREAIYKGDLSLDANALQKAKEEVRTNATIKSGFGDFLAAECSDAVARVGNDVFTIKDDIDKVYDASAGDFFVEKHVELLGRRMEFKIEQDASDKYRVTSTLVYTYCINEYPYYVLEEESSGVAPSDEYDGEDTQQGNLSQGIRENMPNNKIRYPKAGEEPLRVALATDEVIYENPTTAKLDSLFVYYYPQYDFEDTIVIDNDALIDDFRCYILKQGDGSKTPTLEAKENSYKPIVDIKHNGKKMKVFHNLDVNLCDNTKRTGGADRITSAPSNVEKISYYKDPASLDPNELETAFSGSEKKTLFYKLKVEMFSSGALDADPDAVPITQLDGSMNEPIK